MKEWLNELKDAVYDVDDLLDEIATEALQCKLEAESQTCKHKYFKFISGIVNLFEKGIESELLKILHRLEYITQQRDVLGLKEIDVGAPPRELTTSCTEEYGVYGRDIDRKVWRPNFDKLKVRFFLACVQKIRARLHTC